MSEGRTQPNILITGTPGTGKTTTAELLASASGFKHINVGDLVKKDGLHSGWDEEFQAYYIDEDKVRQWDYCFFQLHLYTIQSSLGLD
jgi:adenylate kinase